MRPEVGLHLRSTLPRLRLFWAAALGASLACAGLGLLASPVVSAARAAPTPLLATAVTALGVLCGAVTLALDRAILAPRRVAARVAIPDADLAGRYLLAGHLALWSLALLPGLLGFAQLLLDGPLRTHLALCAVSLGILARLMPSRSRISARFAAVLR